MEVGIVSLVLNIVLAVIVALRRRDSNRFKLRFEEFKAETERDARELELHGQTLNIIPEMMKLFAAQSTVYEEIAGVLRDSPSRHENTISVIRETATQARRERQSIQAAQSDMHKTLQEIPGATERVLHPSFKHVPSETGDLILPRLVEMQAVITAEFNTRLTVLQTEITCEVNDTMKRFENAMRELQNIPTTIRAAIKMEMEELRRKCAEAIEKSKPVTDDVTDSAEKVQNENDDWTDAAADEAA